MFRVAVLTCLVVAAIASPFTFSSDLDDDWQTFKGLYSKQYNRMGEETVRRAIWESNLQYIEQHNLEADRGVHTFWLGENEFTDMTNEEFVKLMNGYKQNVTQKSPCTKFMPPSHVSLEDLPDSVDWRKEGYVTEVKNQGQCGSCWSFSATGSLEGQHFKKTKQLVSLSEQNLMDCSTKEGNKGCKGGLMDNAFAYIIENGGIDTEASYPYRAKNGICRFSKANIGATEVGCQDIPSGSESDLQSAVATVGPISVAIDAGHPSFQMYKRGVYTERRCSSKKLDHGVLAVGYGNEGQDYWLVKNSWGPRWGMQGYIMMARNDNNMCGIATQASFPTV